MNTNIKKHLSYYLSLLVIQGFGLALLAAIGPNVSLEIAVIVFISLVYTGWGILHFYVAHELHPKIVIEYVLMGALGIALALFFLRLV